MSGFVHVHEAGHVIVAEATGIRVNSVTVRDDDSGCVSPGFSICGRASDESAPLMYAAGWAASLLAGQDPDAAESCARDDIKIMAGLPYFVSYGEFVAFRQRAALILDDHRGALNRLASVLLVPGVYDGLALRALMIGAETTSGDHAMRALEARAAADRDAMRAFEARSSL